MGVRLTLSRLDPDVFFEATGEACRAARVFARPDLDVPCWIPSFLSGDASRLSNRQRGQWDRAYAAAVFSPWDHATHTAAIERVELGKTWYSLEVLTDAAGWAGARGPAPASASPLARAVFGVHELPPALARRLDFPLRFVFPCETEPLVAALREADLDVLRDAVPWDALDGHDRRAALDYPTDPATVDHVRGFYERADAAGHVVLSTLG